MGDYPGFHFKGDSLYCESVPVVNIVESHDTPLYVYSEHTLLSRARDYLFSAAAVDKNALICFAVKANGNINLLKKLAAVGLGADVTSGGELHLALSSDIDPDKIVFSGVGKTREEIEFAIRSKIRALHVESAGELEVISEVSKSIGVCCPFALRVNPDVDVQTHRHMSTGGRVHKFGVPADEAYELAMKYRSSANVKLVGLAVHIGSQIRQLDPYRNAANILCQLAGKLEEANVKLDYLDMGGGLGIDYDGMGAPALSQLMNAIRCVTESGYRLVLEPGRSIVGPAGMLVATVLYIKNSGSTQQAILDAGMNDLLRPALYDAYHPITLFKPPLEPAQELVKYDLVGPVCETADILARNRTLPLLRPGDLIGIGHAGAYGYSMSSNYNGRLKPAEVLVSGDSYHLIRRREDYQDLISGQV